MSFTLRAGRPGRPARDHERPWMKQPTQRWSAVVLGAGLYGIYAALRLARQGRDVLVLEHDDEPFSRATYINQARVHMGYHYPRSITTAQKSAHYFNRFMEDYGFCVHTEFDQVYATSATCSWTSAEQFVRFCESAQIPCEEVPVARYFRPGLVDGAFLTREYTYDAHVLRDRLLAELVARPEARVTYGARITGDAEKDGDEWLVPTSAGTLRTPFVLNATYASTNQVSRRFGFPPFDIKYELCEIILCDASDELRGTGLTVMDGPFFSIMPFGKTGLHSLTSVTFTPHDTSYDELPSFGCQACSGGACSPAQLGNCNLCPARPESAWPYMSSLAHKYMRDDLGFSYRSSLFSMKPILQASEVDDSRPTVVRTWSESPRYVSVLSGKINTVYDLEEVLG